MFKQILSMMRFKIALSILLSAFGAAVSVYLFTIIGDIVDENSQVDLGSSLALYCGILLCSLSVSVGSFYLMAKISASLVYQLRMGLSAKVLGTDIAELEKNGEHRIYNALTTDINNISVAMAETPSLIFYCMLVLSCLGYLAWLSPGYMGVIGVVLLPVLVLLHFISSKGTQKTLATRKVQDDVFFGVRGLVEGAKTLSLNKSRRDFYLQQVVDKDAARLQTLDFQTRVIWGLNHSVGSMLLFVFIGGVAFWSVKLGEAGQVGMFIVVMTYCIGPIDYILNTIQLLARGKASLSRLQALDLTAKQGLQSADQVSFSQWQTIELAALEFTYPTQDDGEKPFSIGPVNLTINRGEIIFLAGGNGSGKTTLVKSLTHLYAPTNGTILVDQQKVQGLGIEAYRELFTMTFSDQYLFEHVIDNKGVPVADEVIMQWVDRMGLSGKVEVINGAFSTTRLSMGQRKRLAFILNVFDNKDIIIFDEWAADQDPHFRAMFYQQLLPELQAAGKTVLAITHDDKYFDCCDLLLTFEQGQFKQIEPSADILNKVS
ncbi:cyclic peptide export ABC transporter [uncultured Shewanella sp.]|uniref:cyclic peptide export ABC transporter n=1 Tax=uncultured Shewanella sp. TaxID=173975 RepID=UPI00262B204C|nr:cyclic peptide export ABC transporter [uncultured Shewanella sp.]